MMNLNERIPTMANPDNETIRKVIGSKIRKLRELNNMTQMDLAFRLDYESTGMISQIENGLKGMGLSRLKKCADIFKVPLSSLLGDKEYPKEEMEMLHKLIEILGSPPEKRHPHYDAIRLLLKNTLIS